jgi:hypothetical protein
MSNLLLAYNNRADGAALTAGDWSASLPRDNVKDGDISLVARTANAARASTRFRADLGASYTLQALALVNHNFSTAATWRVRLGTAPVDLDFAQETMDERITFSGGANGTRVNSAGLIVAAACPRIGYDPITHACLGLLVEEQRTNLLTYSEDFTQAAWTKGGAGISGTTTSPTGAATANILVEDGSAATHQIYRTQAVTAGSAIPLSLFVKPSSGNRWVRLQASSDAGANGFRWLFNPSTGQSAMAAVAFGTGTVGLPTIEALPNGWYRISITGTVDAAATSAALNYLLQDQGSAYNGAYTGDGASGLYLFGAQAEQGTFPTSYIPTTSAAVTRTADSPIMSGTNFSDWYRQDEGTFAASWSTVCGASAGASSTRVFALSNGTNNERLIGYALSTTIISGGTGVGATSTAGMGAYLDPTGAIAAWAYKLNEGGFSKNGVVAATDTSFTLPVGLNQIALGNNSPIGPGATLNGHIKRLVYWPTRLTNAQLQSITTNGPDALGFNSGFIPVKQLTFHGDTPSDWGAQYAAIAALPAAISARYATVEIDDTANAAGHLDIGRLFVGGGLQPAYNASYAGFADEREELSTVVANPNGKRFGTARRRPRGVRFALQYTSQAEADRIHEMQAEVGTLDEVLYVPDPADAAHSQRYGFLGHLRQLSPIEYPFVLKRSIGFEIGEKL